MEANNLNCDGSTGGYAVDKNTDPRNKTQGLMKSGGLDSSIWKKDNKVAAYMEDNTFDETSPFVKKSIKSQQNYYVKDGTNENSESAMKLPEIVS